MSEQVLGIDIGGSGIKAALVDIASGAFVGDRVRIPTPQPSKPRAVAEVVAQLTQRFNWQAPLGCTFPAVVKQGVVYTAANVDNDWIGANGQELLQEATNCAITLLNDADAAGIAEMVFGAGRNQRGVVMLLTFGTGIGSALFLDGKLVPNTELGHLQVRDKDAEDRASDRTREEKHWNWAEWSKRVNEYLGWLDRLFTPDLYIIGGGVSKHHAEFLNLWRAQAPIVPAQLLNDAGIVGAALATKLAPHGVDV